MTRRSVPDSQPHDPDHVTAHSHVRDHASDPGGQGLTAAEAARRLKAVRILVVVLVPIAIWTVVGLIVFWPGDISSHIRQDLSQYSVTGLSIPRAEVTAVQPTSCDGMQGSTPDEGAQACADVTVRLLEGPEAGQSVKVALNSAVFSSGVEVGQEVTLFRLPGQDGKAAYQFADFERRIPMLVFALLFVAAVVVVARRRGALALVGLAFAGFILVKFMFPALLVGTNPIVVGLLGSSAIMFVVLYAAHGFSARTTTALVGTLFGLLITAGLGAFATRWAHLTGVSSDDDFVLSATAPDLSLTSVVICGMILAGLGVLNDVTITQASAVWELADSDPDPDPRRLFGRAMRIGRDHIASTVYTLAFATAGASLAALLLIAIYDRPLLEVIQTEMFAAEILGILVGSIGLVLAVPLTTAIGVAVVRASTATTTKPALAAAAPAESDAASSNAAASDGEASDAQASEEKAAGADEPDTAILTRVEPEAPAAEAPKSARKRRFGRKADDFGDFSDLHDPDEPARTPRD